MHALIEALCESRVDKLTTATKLRNAVVKALKAKGFSAEPLGSWSGQSNPYSNSQSLSFSVDPRKGYTKKNEKLIAAAFKGLGLKVTVKSHTSSKGTQVSILGGHPSDDRVYVRVFANTEKRGKYGHKRWTGRVFGPKKAKRSNLPYYD